MIVPWSAPIAAHARRPAMMAAHHGQPVDCLTSPAVMTPPMPLTKSQVLPYHRNVVGLEA